MPSSPDTRWRKHRPEKKEAIGAYTSASLYHAYVRIFLSQARMCAAMLLIVSVGLNRWKRRRGRIFPHNSCGKLANRIPNAHHYQEMLWTERNLSISSGKRTWESAAKPRNWPALTSHPRLLPCSRVSSHTPLARCFSRKSCSQAVAVFIVVRDGCIDVIISHSISSVPIPLKVFIKCWHLLSLSTPEQERTKLFKLSSVNNSVNSHHFCEI